MGRYLLGLLAWLLSVSAAAAQPAPRCTLPADRPVVTQDIAEGGLVAQYIRPEGETRRLPALIVLGGSEGGTRWVRRAGARFAAQHPDAIIPVERINGPVLLVSGEADGLWPAKTMADAIAARLRANDFRHGVVNLSWPDAGHMTPTPPGLGPTPPGEPAQMGGTVEGTDRARAAAWPAMICFLREALGAPVRR